MNLFDALNVKQLPVPNDVKGGLSIAVASYVAPPETELVQVLPLPE